MCDYCGCVEAWENRETERSIQGGAERACVDIYMDYLVSEVSRLPVSIRSAWEIGQGLYNTRKLYELT